MAWRNHNTHREETKAVKEALKKAGINAMVGHGTGTAWGWLTINIGRRQNHKPEENGRCHPSYCPGCIAHRELYEKTQKIVQEVTGRHGEYDGEINIYAQDHWDRKLNKNVPILQPEEEAPKEALKHTEIKEEKDTQEAPKETKRLVHFTIPHEGIPGDKFHICWCYYDEKGEYTGRNEGVRVTEEELYNILKPHLSED